MGLAEQDIAVGGGGISVMLIGATERAPFRLGPAARLRRALARQGATNFIDGQAGMPASGTVLLLRGDHVYDETLSAGLVATRNFVLLDSQGRAVAAHVPAMSAEPARAAIAASSGDRQALIDAGLNVLNAIDLASAQRKKLRTRQPPYIHSLAELPLGQVEWRMYRAAYKGVTDFVTKFIWPLPAFWVTRLCARRGISPNMVTLVSLACVIAATWLFAIGWFGIGLVFAWAMAFLDTVDGKLARVTLTSSTWGEIFDHGIDHIHPPFWWLAWWYGLGGSAGPDNGLQLVALWIVIGGYVVGRLQEGIFLWRLKMEMYVWQRIDSLFRLITARRNPNLAILTGFTLAGRPDLGFAAMAAWTLASLAFHFVRMGQAFRAKRRDGALHSWMEA